MAGRTAHFTAFLSRIGYHESSWRLAAPGDLAGPARFGVLQKRGLHRSEYTAATPRGHICQGRVADVTEGRDA